MHPSQSQGNTSPNRHLMALVEEFFERRRAGEKLTPEGFAAEHPGLTEALRQHLAALPLVDEACGLQSRDEQQSPIRMAPRPRIAGYELVEEIGRGGMGVVYKAQQLSPKRIVALKVMLAGSFAPASARRRFDREVELAARLQHPCIVRVLESGVADGQRFYAMDYVQGVRLDRFLEDAPLDLGARLRLFTQICEGVEYAHAQGVVHRDLKPANVLVDDEGHPHILDFGLAKATDEADSEEALTTCVSLPGQVVGTLFYLSPEQAAAQSDVVDARTDVYALGIMLFEALTGSLPLDTSGRPSEIIRRILDVPPARPSSLSRQISAELDTIILKALEKERRRRYLSARELADDIGRYLEGEPIRARRPSSLYVLRKRLRKHRTWVALGALALFLVISGVLYDAWFTRHRFAEARQQAIGLQRAMDFGEDVRVAAGTLKCQFPRLIEAQLITAQAMWRTTGGAISVLASELQQHPEYWAHRLLLAEMYREAGEAGRADELQARAEREAPDTAEAWYLRSFATLDRGIASHCAGQAVRIDPGHALAWQRLAYLRALDADLSGTIEAADALIALGEASQSWQGFKANVLVRQGRVREAIDIFTEEQGWLDRAHAYRRLKEYDKALDDYNRYLAAQDETTVPVWLFYQRATPLWILGRRAEAVEDYRRVRLLLGRPYYSDARQYIILRELGRDAEAEQVLSKALAEVEDPWLRRIFKCFAGELTPEQLVASPAVANKPEKLCEAYYYAGEECLLAGQPAEARTYFERCVQTDMAFDPDTQVGTPMNEYELAEWRLESLP